MSKLTAQPLRIAVVGHTNTGKTSLLRTLTRDKRFGEVSAMPSTTRHVEVTGLTLGQQRVVELFDTPGLEESIALLERLDTLTSESGERLDGLGRIRHFLDLPEAHTRFEQEAKVLRQMLLSDAALYVIDARDPVLAKHRDELAILHSCAIPVLPLLNFVGTPRAHEKAWRDALARLGLHVVVSFDTVAPAADGERVLYAKLATLLDARGTVLQRLVQQHEEDAGRRRQEAMGLLAELLIDTAAYRVPVPESTEAALYGALVAFNDAVRAREQACVEALLGLYRFGPEDIDAAALPLTQGAWRDDLFDPATLGALGLSLSSGAAAGAAAGLGIDLMLGGASLGTGAALGALIGGGTQTLRHHGRRLGQSLLSTLTGTRQLRVEEPVLQVLLTRQWRLIRALERRGHAAIAQIALGDEALGALWQDSLRAALSQCRQHPGWSAIGGRLSFDPAREAHRKTIAHQLDALLAQWAVQP